MAGIYAGFRAAVGKARGELLSRLDCRTLSIKGRGPFVTFSFDDFPRTALTVGGAVLAQHGVRGTYYAALGLEGVLNELGEHFNAADLCCVVAAGHELGNHTFSHISARKSPPHAFEADACRGRRALAAREGGAVGVNFAYPYGHVTRATKTTVGDLMTSCRGTYAGRNGPLVDLRLLRANSLVGGLEGFKAARRLIDRNRLDKTWLIFYTHDVSSNPSRFGCTPELLDAVVRAAVESTAAVLPVGAVLASL